MWNLFELKEQSNMTINSNDVSVMQEVILRMYNCPLAQVDRSTVVSVMPSIANETHCNLLPALMALEFSTSFIIIYEQTAKHTVRE